MDRVRRRRGPGVNPGESKWPQGREDLKVHLGKPGGWAREEIKHDMVNREGHRVSPIYPTIEFRHLAKNIFSIMLDYENDENEYDNEVDSANNEVIDGDLAKS
jgi:hypothetical protein